ncbi:MAG: response regulator transcription factor [Solirubrobacteraceae bacterium]
MTRRENASGPRSLRRQRTHNAASTRRRARRPDRRRQAFVGCLGRSLRRSNAEIATALRVSVETVRTHARHVYRKLGVSTRRELVTHR